MKKQIKKRIRSRAGETIAEVLISVLISALALSLLAGMILAAKNMVERSKSSTEKYIQAENLLVEQRAGTSVTSGGGKVTLSLKKLADTGPGSFLTSDEKCEIDVTTYTIQDSKPSVVSYKVK